MNLTLGDVQDLTEETVTEILRRVEAEVAKEKDSLLAQERSRHEETARAKAVVERRHRDVESRLYWLSDNIGRIVATALATVIAASILLGSVWSGMTIEKYLGGRWWLNALIVLGGIVAGMFVIAKHLLSVVKLHQWMRQRVRFVLFRSLAGTTEPGEMREIRGQIPK